jgi:hypothetical protein
MDPWSVRCDPCERNKKRSVIMNADLRFLAIQIRSVLP